MIIDKDFCSKKDQLDLMNSLTSKTAPAFWKFQPRVHDNMKGFAIQQSMRSEDFRMIHIMPPNTSHYALSIKIFNAFIEKNNLKCKEILQVSSVLLPKFASKKHIATINTERKHNTFIYFVNQSDSNVAIYDQIFNTNHAMEHLNIIDTIDGEMGKAICFDGLNYHSIGYPEKSNFACVLIIDFIPELLLSGGKDGLYRY